MELRAQRWVVLSQEEAGGSKSQQAVMVKPKGRVHWSVGNYRERSKDPAVTVWALESGDLEDTRLQQAPMADPATRAETGLLGRSPESRCPLQRAQEGVEGKGLRKG